MRYLLDTNFIIGLHKFDNAINFIKKNKIDYQTCAISVITYLEALGFQGHNEADKLTMSNILSLFTCVQLTNPIQQKTILIRQQNKIKLPL